MNIKGCTDKGLIRQSNQDAFMTGVFDDGVVWAVVCDGMGGANGGNIASRLAVDYFSASLKSGYRTGMNEISIKNLLNSAVNSANVRVFDKSRESNELNGMGTTIVAVIVIDNIAYVTHIGDSRAYILNNGEFYQVTRDHSIVQSMIEDGKLSPEEARFHPRKNVITRALGVDESVSVEFTVCDFNENDKILLCTDGLSNFVSNEKMLGIIANMSCEESVSALINEANNNGGGDNITAVVIENI
jgi:protein phosphatase